MSTPSIQIIRLQHSDVPLFQDLLILLNEVFECDDQKQPSENYLKSLLAKEDFVAFVLLVDHKVMGGLTAYILAKYYSEGSELYIYDLAIDPEMQRQGLATQLLEEVKKYCKTQEVNYNCCSFFFIPNINSRYRCRQRYINYQAAFKSRLCLFWYCQYSSHFCY